MHEMRGPVLLSGEHLPKADVLWRNLDATVLPDELERRLSMASGGDLGDDRADGRANEGSRSSSTGARQMIAERIGKLLPSVENDDLAQVVLHLAEAYAQLAMEPPRSRAG